MPKSNLNRTIVGGLIAAAAVSLGLSACVAEGTVLWSNPNIRGHVPGFDSEDTLLAANCISAGRANGSMLTVDCHAALSNGVTDLLNDIETVTNVPLVGPEVESYLLNTARARCTEGMQIGIDNAINAMPTAQYRALMVDYINKQHIRENAAGYCNRAIDTIWNEVDDNIYSDGSKCVVGKVRIAFMSVNEGPKLTFSVYPVDQFYCPRSRLRIDGPGFFDPFWGND